MIAPTRSLRFPFVLAAVVAIAACTATDPAPATPTATPAMPPVPPTAEAAPAPTATASATATVSPLPKNLKVAMQGIDEDWKYVEKAIGAPTDLEHFAGAATRIAKVMKLAHDPWEDKETPDFGKFALEAEAAFTELAKKAKAGDAEAVKAMGPTLHKQHCARCHDAYEVVHG